MPSVYLPCPDCKNLSYYIRQDARAGRNVVVCAGCGREIVEMEFEPQHVASPGQAPVP